MNSYWKKRQHLLYYQAVRILTEDLAAGASSIIDVGSSGCPYLDWFPDVPHRTSLDLRKPYKAPGVNSVTADLLEWEPDRHYDVVLCLQVIEHVPEAEAFAQKLLTLGDVLVATVPHRWNPGTPGHVHDPVDEAKMLSWFGRQPNYSYICREIASPAGRLLNVYEQHDQRWPSLRHRKELLAKMAADAEASTAAA